MLSHVVLVLWFAAWAGTGWRWAGSLSIPLGGRLLAATSLTLAGQTGSSQLLGLMGIGNSSVAAVGLLVVAIAASSRLTKPRVTGASAPMLDFGQRYFRWLAACSTLFVAATVVLRPAFGFDGLEYHLPLVFSWLTEGSTGAANQVSVEYAAEYYPLGYHVLLTSWLAIAPSWALVILMQVFSALLLGVSMFLGATWLGGRRVFAGATVAVLFSAPVLLHQVTAVGNDLFALAWLACTGALAMSAVRFDTTGPLPYACLAAGLGLGAKPTVGPAMLFIGTLVIWYWRGRLRHLIPRGAPCRLVVAAAVVLGSYWYVRNTAVNGSPLWPQVGLPWGEPTQAWFSATSRFIEFPIETFQGRFRDLRASLGGGTILVMLCAALLPWLGKDRVVRTAAAAYLLSLLIWMMAPATGSSVSDEFQRVLSLAGLRYLLPSVLLALLAVGLTAGGQGLHARAARVALSVALVANLADAARLADTTGWVLRALVLAAMVAWIFAKLTHGLRLRPIPTAVYPFVAAGTAVALMSAGIGILGRYENGNEATDTDRAVLQVTGALGPDAPVGMLPTMNALAAGDEMTRPLTLIAHDADCAHVRRSAAGIRSVIQIRRSPMQLGPVRPMLATKCLAAVAPSASVGRVWLYR